MANLSKVYIILVNWNGWFDTIECLESIFRNNYPSYQVIVCDNDSQDNSVEYIKAWAEGRLDVWIHPSNSLRYLSNPPVSKPIRYVESDKFVLEKGYDTLGEKASLIIINTGDNLGFGKANNIGIQYSFNRDADYVWLINNDTVINTNAISEIVSVANSGVGITGSILRYYERPHEIQAYGGGYFSQHTGLLKHEQNSIHRNLNFITGASMMISRNTFTILGGFDPNIFMYFEDIDYCIRAIKNNILLSCSDAVIFHKVGKSSGGENNYFASFNGYKNRFYSLKKNYGLSLWVFFHIASLCINIINPKVGRGKRKACRENLVLIFKMITKKLTTIS